MDDALAQWLALREAADTSARSLDLTQLIATNVDAHDPVRILDLATGTGSNFRYLAERLPGNQEWLVVDRSETLLTELPARTKQWAMTRGFDMAQRGKEFVVRNARTEWQVGMRQLNLGMLDAAALFEGRHLVTASALLDLVSDAWLRSLASHCRRAGAAVLFAITYNGKSSCSPEEPEDGFVLDRFNRHQHTDKGLGGPAAGPDAVQAADRAFLDAGYRIRTEASDWQLSPADRELQRQLIEGWAEASTEIAPADGPMIAAWRRRRLAHVDAGISRIVVGHHDLAAWL